MRSSPSEPSTPGLHPLEAIAPLHRGPRSTLRDVGATLLINAVVGLILTATEQLFARRPDPLPVSLASMLFAANVVGFMIHGALFALHRLAPAVSRGRPRAWRRWRCQASVSCAECRWRAPCFPAPAPGNCPARAR